MADSHRTDIAAALQRVMETHGNVGNPTRWAKSAELPRQTVADAVKGANATLVTLQKLAAAANMTLAEMLEYGDPDWEAKVAARTLLKDMSKDEILALATILHGRNARAAS